MRIIRKVKGGEDKVALDWSHIISKYKGMWVALQDDEVTVIDADKDAQKLKQKASKKGFEHPILIKVPTKLSPYVG